MCLLVVLHRTHPDAELLLAANRDELLERPATAMTVLQEREPRILGGRDEVAGGTWMAVNEHGLFAALTNRPSKSRDSTKRSRGQWPIFLASFASPTEAASAFVERFDPRDFNPGWILVGNGKQLVYIDMTLGNRGRLLELEPGTHILENRPLGARSSKVDRVRHRLEGIDRLHGGDAIESLQRILGDHTSSEGSAKTLDDAGLARPAAAGAACVHLGAYGTRSAAIVRSEPSGAPSIWSAEGPPCTSPFVEATGLWHTRFAGVAGG